MIKKINYSYKARIKINNEKNKSNNAQFESVLYCHHCHKMNKFLDFLTLEKGVIDDDLKKELDYGASHHYQYSSSSDLIEDYALFGDACCGFDKLQQLVFKKENKKNPLLTCPECGEIIKNKDVFNLSKSKEWIRNNSFIYKYEIFKEEDKLIYSIDLFSVFPVTDYGKLKYKKINLRLVFNTKTHNVYAFQPYDLDTNKPLYRNNRRILNITYFTNSRIFLSDIYNKVLKDNNVLKYLAEYLCKYYNKDFNESFDKKMNFKDILTFFRYHEYNKKTRQCINIFTCDTYYDKNIHQKMKVILQDIYKMQYDRDYLLEIIKKKKCPLKKKFIKMCATNPFYIYLYKELKKVGMKDYNVILDILEIIINCAEDSYDNFFVRANENFFQVMMNSFLNKDKLSRFFEIIIKLKGDIWCKNNIFKFFIDEKSAQIQSYAHYNDMNKLEFFIDTCNLLEIFIDNDMDLSNYICDIYNMHNRLSRDYNKIKHKNKLIPYDKKLMKLNCDINEYHFRLAPDTYSLVNCGECMGICVGSYGNQAYSGSSIIVFLFKNDKYVSCIELSKNLTLVQAKAKYNNKVQKDDAYVLKEWVTINNINTSNCFDYAHIEKDEIEYDDDKIYTRNLNYASVKYDNLNEINKNNSYDYNYKII